MYTLPPIFPFPHHKLHPSSEFSSCQKPVDTLSPLGTRILYANEATACRLVCNTGAFARGAKNTIAILAENMGEPNKTFWELKQFNFWPCERRCGYRKVCESFSVAAKNRQNFVARDEL